MKLVRVVSYGNPHFVAGFETDGIIRRTAPILKVMRGWTDERARRYMKRKGWKASVVPDQVAFNFHDPCSDAPDPAAPSEAEPAAP